MTRMIWASAIAIVIFATAAGVARAEAPARLLVAGQQRVPATNATADMKIKGLQDGVVMDRSPARVLRGLRTTFDPKIGAHLGLRDPTDAQNTEVGAPIRVMVIDAGSLKTYDGSSPDPLLREVPLVARLVRVQGQARSMIIQSNASGTWQTVQMGDTLRAAAIEQIGAVLASTQGVAESDLFLVRIPALGLDFLAYRKGSVRLTPLFDTPAWGLQAGRTSDAAPLLSSLIAPAQAARTNGRVH